MLRVLTIVLTALSLSNNAYAVCKCARSVYTTNTIPATVFTFSNNMRLAVCGIKEIDLPNNKAMYTEFVLSVCGTDSNIKISGAEEHVIYMDNDTLYLLQQDMLAIGNKMELTKATWRIERMYYSNGNWMTKRETNHDLRYTREEINSVLRQYERTDIRAQGEVSTKEDDKMIHLANKLMIAALSGNRKAEKYFYEFGKHFKPGGEYAEWYEDMAAMLDTAFKRSED